MAFTAVCCFWDMLRPDGRERKIAAWRPHKRREDAGEYKDMGKIKPAPGKPRAGAGGIQDFFAVSQITINGRRIINRIIMRGPPPL